MWYLVNSILAYFNLEIVQYEEEDEVPDETNQITCRNCGKLVFYTPDNTTYYWWADFAWYSVAVSDCGECDFRQGFYLIERLDWELQWAKANDIDIVVLSGLPPKHVIKAFHETYPEFMEYRELSKMEEADILFFGYLLETTEDTDWFK